MHKFTKIQGFNNVVKYARSRPERFTDPVYFSGTVKLHGTNAGVRITSDGELIPQSRNRELTLDKDNCGFAAFVLQPKVKRHLVDLASSIPEWSPKSIDIESMTIYGEWVGPGIQKGVAVNQLPDKQFVIFAAGVTTPTEDGSVMRFVDLLAPEEMIAPDLRIRAINEVPVRGARVDLLSRGECTRFAEELNALTAEVDERCPWAKALFDIDGVGEGYVWRPAGKHFQNTDLFFKVKGAKHGEKGAEKKARTAAPNLESVERFVEHAVTEDRVRNAIDHLKELGKPITMQSTGDYLKRMNTDIIEECGDELVASGLEWKQVQKAVTAEALIHWKKAAA